MHYRKPCTLDAHSLQKTFASLTIFINFVSPYAENALCGMGGRGARHIKRRLLRFGSDG